MSWFDRTPGERRELQQRRAARRSRKARLEERLWAGKRAAARTPEDLAALEWDLARKRIRGLGDAGERDAEWSRLAGVLHDFNGDGR